VACAAAPAGAHGVVAAHVDHRPATGTGATVDVVPLREVFTQL
jgi:hypothetical protein